MSRSASSSDRRGAGRGGCSAHLRTGTCRWLHFRVAPGRRLGVPIRELENIQQLPDRQCHETLALDLLFPSSPGRDVRRSVTLTLVVLALDPAPSAAVAGVSRRVIRRRPGDTFSQAARRNQSLPGRRRVGGIETPCQVDGGGAALDPDGDQQLAAHVSSWPGAGGDERGRRPAAASR